MSYEGAGSRLTWLSLELSNTMKLNSPVQYWIPRMIKPFHQITDICYANHATDSQTKSVASIWCIVIRAHLWVYSPPTIIYSMTTLICTGTTPVLYEKRIVKASVWKTARHCILSTPIKLPSKRMLPSLRNHSFNRSWFALSSPIFTSYLISQKDQSSLLSHSRPHILRAMKFMRLKKISFEKSPQPIDAITVRDN